MKTFKELIKSGIAPTHVSEWGRNVPNTITDDKLIVEYNRRYGIANDTHLDKNNNGYCITGSAVADTKKFNVFLCSTSYNNVVFPCPICELFKLNDLQGEYSTQNGQVIYQLKPIVK